MLRRLAAGDLPADFAERKRRKPDLEALVLLPGQGTLLALGSGSRAQRERGFLVQLQADGSLGAALSLEAWIVLRRRDGLSFERAAAVWRLTLQALLAHGFTAAATE